MINRKWVLAVLTVLFVSSVAMAQFKNFEKDLFPHRVNFDNRDIVFASDKTDNYDLKYYRFDIEVDPSKKYISGHVAPKFLVTKENTNSIYFDFNAGMHVDSVKYHGQLLSSSFTGDYELKIDLPSNLVKGNLDSISIWYQGDPSSSGFGSFEIGDQGCNRDEPLLWTLSEPYGARDWWPTKQSLNDKIDSIDMFVTTPLGNKVGSNGLLLSVNEVNGKLIHHWKHTYPEPAYLIAIAVSKYDEYIDWVPLESGDSLMVLEYVFPCNLEYAKGKTSDIVPTIQFFISLFGDYPYDKEKYGHAQFGWGGGMEHSSMTFVSGFSHGLLAHELAHQWFGDKITCGSWQDIWLNEGFATYLEGLTYDFGRNDATWKYWKSRNKQRALYASHGSVFVRDTTVGNIFNGSLSYAKGAYLLHMLRWKMGDDNFFNALKNYISDPELVYGYARTKDLQKHLEAQSGLNLNEFFNDWLYGKGNPTYSFDWWYNGDGSISVRINQSQSDSSVDFFEMPVPIEFVGAGVDTILVFDNNSNGQEFNVKLDFKVDSIVFDPEQWLCAGFEKTNYLKTVDLKDAEGILLYPNPANEIISIELEENIYIDNITIWDIDGKNIIKNSIQANIQKAKIPVSTLNSGMYLMKIVSNDGVFVKRFIKE